MQASHTVLIVPFFVSLILMFLFGYVIGQKRQSPVKTAFLLFLCANLAVEFAEFFFRLDISHQINVFINHAGLLALLCVGFFYMNFMFAVTGTPRNKAYQIFRVGVIVSMIASLRFGTFTIDYPEGFQGVPVSQFSGLFSLVLGAAVLVPSAYGALLCVTRYRAVDNLRERRILGILIKGIIASLSVGVFVFVIVPLFFPGQTEIYLFTSLGSLVHFAYMYIAVSKYHFLTFDLDEIEEVSRSLFAKSMDAVVIFSPTGKVIQANERSEMFFGAKVTLASIQTAIPDFDFSKKYEKWHTTLLGEAGERQILVSQSEIGGEAQLYGKLMLIRDITDVVQMEKTVHETEKLKAIGLLAGGVAHDFNNQLMSIMGNAELLQRLLTNDGEAQRYVDNILISSRRSADLTSQLLAFARKGKYRMVPVDLHEIVHEVVGLIERSVDKRMEIVLHLRANSSCTLGDPSQIQSAILNLALNARDAMETNGVMTFRTEVVGIDEIRDLLPNPEKSPEKFVRISVVDTGVGIDEETRQRIFEPFFTTKETGLGTGMGLAAVHGTVENHRGAINVDSKPGQGTSVHVYLPAYEGTLEATSPTEAPATMVNNSGRVLIVDDETQIREVLARMLAEMGYQVMLCGDGEDALALFRREWAQIDFVILDLIMPKISGWEVLREMRKIDPGAKILIASGHCKENDKDGIGGVKPDAFLLKPFRSAELASTIAGMRKSPQS